ncbi:MAG: hypothetical protein AB7F28_02995 [Candidatus Margulisiibacteriota bacterium]
MSRFQLLLACLVVLIASPLLAEQPVYYKYSLGPYVGLHRFAPSKQMGVTAEIGGRASYALDENRGWTGSLGFSPAFENGNALTLFTLSAGYEQGLGTQKWFNSMVRPAIGVGLFADTAKGVWPYVSLTFELVGEPQDTTAIRTLVGTDQLYAIDIQTKFQKILLAEKIEPILSTPVQLENTKKTGLAAALIAPSQLLHIRYTYRTPDDVSTHWARREIATLTSIGIFDSPNRRFYPKTLMTGLDALRLTILATDYLEAAKEESAFSTVVENLDGRRVSVNVALNQEPKSWTLLDTSYSPGTYKNPLPYANLKEGRYEMTLRVSSDAEVVTTSQPVIVATVYRHLAWAPQRIKEVETKNIATLSKFNPAESITKVSFIRLLSQVYTLYTSPMLADTLQREPQPQQVATFVKTIGYTSDWYEAIPTDDPITRAEGALLTYKLLRVLSPEHLPTPD